MAGEKSPLHQRSGRDWSTTLGYQSTVTLVILSASSTSRILASPTTEPGRRGWKRRLGSPISAPHFFAFNLTHPDHSQYPPFYAPHRIESETIESILLSPK